MKLEDVLHNLRRVRDQVGEIEHSIKEGNLIRAASQASDLVGVAHNAFNKVYDLTYPKTEV